MRKGIAEREKRREELESEALEAVFEDLEIVWGVVEKNARVT